MRRNGIRETALLALLAAAGPAAAQSTPATPAPPGTLEAPAEKIEPPAGGAGDNLSDHLKESQGVIRPPANVDPGAVEPTPPAGQFPTPVIPPPAPAPQP